MHTSEEGKQCSVTRLLATVLPMHLVQELNDLGDKRVDGIESTGR